MIWFTNALFGWGFWNCPSWESACLTSQRALPRHWKFGGSFASAGAVFAEERSQSQVVRWKKSSLSCLAYYRLEGRNMKALRIIMITTEPLFHLPGFTRRFPGMVNSCNMGFCCHTMPHHSFLSPALTKRTQSWRCGHEKSQVRGLVTRNRYCAFCAFFLMWPFPVMRYFPFPLKSYYYFVWSFFVDDCTWFYMYI